MTNSVKEQKNFFINLLFLKVSLLPWHCRLTIAPVIRMIIHSSVAPRALHKMTMSSNSTLAFSPGQVGNAWRMWVTVEVLLPSSFWRRDIWISSWCFLATRRKYFSHFCCIVIAFIAFLGFSKGHCVVSLRIGQTMQLRPRPLSCPFPFLYNSLSALLNYSPPAWPHA